MHSGGHGGYFCSKMADYLVCMPFSFQMVGLYKDPKGEDIFTSVNSHTHTSTSGTSQSKGGGGDEETLSLLQRRIKELEDEVKEKDVRATSYSSILQLEDPPTRG